MAKTVISLTFLCVVLLIVFKQSVGKCSSKIKHNRGFNGMFVFGSSIVDNGNNNFIKTPAKADYLPYGIDFRPLSQPTGRLTNGKTLADRIGDVLSLPMTPPYSDPQTKKGVGISYGVNHASAGSGILDSTDSSLGVIRLSEQIRSFVKTTLRNLEGQQGCPGPYLLPRYLFLFSSGANDIRAYFAEGMGNTVTLEEFTANLTSSLATQITRLYNVGARKFAFLNASPLGCTPAARATMPNYACNEAVNYAAYIFNTHLLLMLNSIKSQLPGFRFVLINFFQIGLEFTQNPSSGGFSDVKSTCCEVSKESGGVLCRRGGSVCSNRSNHMYFDGLHPTEAFYSIIANRAYYSNSLTQVYPYNLRRLSRLST